MSTWKRVSVADVCSSITDCINKTAPKIDEPSPFKMIRTTNIRYGLVDVESVKYVTEETYHQWTRRQVPQRGDVLLTREAPMGEAGMLLTDERVFLGQRIVSYRADPNKLDNYFLLYALQSDDLQSQIKSRASGSTVQHMRVPDTKKLQIPLPLLPEQRRIVAILDEVFAGIDDAIANTEKNLTNARELFESHLEIIFLKKGEGWIDTNLGKVCDFLNGFAFKSADTVSSSNVQLIRMGNLYQNVLNLERKPAFYPNGFGKLYPRYILEEGDLIMSLTGTVDKEDYGYTVEVPKTERTLLLNQRIAKFTNINTDCVEKRFFLFLLRSKIFLKALYSSARGVRQANLSSTSMKALQISLPPIDMQKSLVFEFHQLEDSTHHLEAIYQQKLTALNELKQSILQKAFTGELTADTASEATRAKAEIAA